VNYVVVLVRELGRYASREAAEGAAVLSDESGDLVIVKLPAEEQEVEKASKPKRRRR
jgi:hypothetical protein